MRKPSIRTLLLRKEKLESRLSEYGLDKTFIDISLFDETLQKHIHPQYAAERLLILLAVSYAAYNFNESDKVMDWLKTENLWRSASEKEKDFFRDPDPEEEEKQDLSWRFEGAYALAWALGKVKSQADPRIECNEDQVNEFLRCIPSVGSSTDQFFAALTFRPLVEILEEHLFYDTATKYFQQIRAQDKENTSPVHMKASFERSNVLTWLRSSGSGTDWDSLATPSEK